MKTNYSQHRGSWSALGLLTILCTTRALAADSAVIQTPLVNTGVDSNATGTASMKFGSSSATVLIKAANLTPGQTYTLYVGAIPESVAAADAKGRWSARFRTPKNSSSQWLDFDPRGAVVALHDGNTNVLAALISRTGEPAGSRVVEHTEIKDGKRKATLTYQLQKSGRRSFVTKLSGVSGSNWVFYLNGSNVSAIPVKGSSGSAKFDSAPTSSSSQILNFDPRGVGADIAQSNTLVFTGPVEAQIRNVNVATPARQLASIPATGLDPDGTAKASLRVDSKARRKFSVEIEDVPVGRYEFLANDVSLGSINVVVGPSGTRGEIEFSSREDDGDELPLTFEPTNSVFTIRQGAAVYFTGAVVLPTVSGTNEAPAELDEALSSTGLDGDASGSIRYRIRDDGRRDFNVEIEDVPVGSYQLWVGGTQRGNLSVANRNGAIEGEIEFRNPVEAGKVNLNFDPRGQLIEVKNAAGTYFAHLFGGSGGTGGPGTNAVLVVPMEINLPLFNTGVAPGATAKAEFKRKDDGDRNFEVEIEDAPAGNYNLMVGGVIRATISVQARVGGGTAGQVEFDSDSPTNGELLLNFDPRGQEIELRRNDQVYFARLFPVGS